MHNNMNIYLENTHSLHFMAAIFRLQLLEIYYYLCFIVTQQLW